MNTSIEVALPWVRISGGISFILVAGSGLILNTLLSFVLYKGRKSFRQNAFFIITWQLIICDVLAHIIAFIVPIPITLAGYDVYDQSLLHLIPGSGETFAYLGTLLFSMLMTINRVTVFIFPTAHGILFKRYLTVTIMVVWSLNAAFLIMWTSIGCIKLFGYSGYHYRHVCLYPSQMQQDTAYGLRVFSTYSPVFMFIVYIILIVFIKFKLDYEVCNWNLRRKSITAGDNGKLKMKREFQLLAQGFLICGLLEVENLVFIYIPFIEVYGQWIHLIDFIGTCLSLMLCCMHPIILFCFNQDIQKRLTNIFSADYLFGNRPPTSVAISY